MTPTLLRAIVALCTLTLAPRVALAQTDPVEDPADSGLEPQAAEAPDAPTELPPLDPRVVPEPASDPALDDDGPRDPADNALLPSGADPMEHDPYSVGAPGALPPPFSTTVDCPPDTRERRTHAERGFELWCADASGRRHGPFLRLHPSGALALRGSYVAGRRHGMFLAWFPSGRLEGRSTFERGLEQGVEDLFYESGRRRASTAYRAGKKHGPHRAWHENGRLALSGEYVDDVAAPGWAFYDESGRVVKATSEAAPASAASADEEPHGAEPSSPLSAEVVAAAAGAGGATLGLVVGVPLSIALISLRVLQPIDPNGWLSLLLVPTFFAAAGAAFGSALLTRFPGVVMAALGAALGFPLGAAVGGLVGGAAGGLLALGSAVLGGGQGALPLLLAGAGIGAGVGALLGPGLIAGSAGWLYAPEAKSLEE